MEETDGVEVAGLRAELAAARLALCHERVLARLRDEAAQFRDFAVLDDHLRGPWPSHLRELGIPVHRISIQMPTPGADQYLQFWSEHYPPGVQAEVQVPMVRCPWVGEAWERGQPVVVPRARLEQCAFPDTGVGTLLEIPLPDSGGSLGVSTHDPSGFSEQQVATLVGFTRIVALALRRLADVQSLRQSEARFRSLVDNLPIGIAHTTADGRIVYQNPHARAIWGYDLQELASLDASRFYARPEDREELVRCLRRSGRHSFEYALRRKNGEVFWGRGTTLAVGPEQGWHEFIGFLEDVTEQRRAVEALQESEERWRKLFTAMPSGCALHRLECDAAGQAVDYVTLAANPAFEALMGVRQEDIVGHPASEFLPPDELRHWLGIFGPVALTGQSANYQVFSAHNGRHYQGQAFSPALGTFVAVFADVTEERRREGADRLAAAVQRVRNAVLQMQSEDDWYRVLAALSAELPAFVPAHDFSVCVVDTEAGSSVFYHVSPNRADSGARHPRVWPAIRQALATNQPVYRRNRAEMADWGDGIADPRVQSVLDVPFSHGTLAVSGFAAGAFDAGHISAVTRFAPVLSEAQRRLLDLAENHRLHAEIEHQRVRAAQVDRLQVLGEMAAGIAHELNQPLNGIRAFAEGALIGLRQGWPTDGEFLAETLTDIIGQVDRATDVIGHMRVLAREDSDQPPVRFAIEQAVDGVLRLVGAQLRVQGIAVRQQLEDDLPACRGWLSAIEQVLFNLLSNASDAIALQRRRQRDDVGAIPPDWRAQIVLAAVADPDRGTVRLTVSDNGGGIPEAAVQRVFEPFFTTKEVGHGTGLGLAIVRAIAQRHGGTVELDNRPGDGAAFTVVLPACA